MLLRNAVKTSISNRPCTGPHAKQSLRMLLVLVIRETAEKFLRSGGLVIKRLLADAEVEIAFNRH